MGDDFVNIQIKNSIKYIFVFLVVVCSLSFLHTTVPSQAATVKIRYNGKTYKNKTKKLNVKYNEKKVSKTGYKALKINKTYMASYYDIFKVGVKAKCNYSSKTKELSINHNGITIKMKVGSKKAYINEKKVTMPTAPVSVRFIKRKKTKILVPIYFVAKNLNLYYEKSSSTIQLKSPLELTYDDLLHYYNGVQGNIFYNQKTYAPTSMPVVKIDNKYYASGEELFQTIMKLDYIYNKTTGTVTITNEDTDKTFVGVIGSSQALLNEKAVNIETPIRLISYNGKEIVGIPMAAVLKHLGYTRGWNKNNKYYSIQTNQFFTWNAELTEEQIAKIEENYISQFKSEYSATPGMNGIRMYITGSQAEIMKTLTVKRTGNQIILTMPKSKYLLEKTQFDKFAMGIVDFEAAEKENIVTITINCDKVADYSYMLSENGTELQLFIYMDSTTDYSMSIPKPENTTIDMVTNNDLYLSKKFQIIIQGDYVEFFKSNPIIINNNSVKGVEISKSENNTVITVSTSSIRGYKIYERDKSFVLEIGSPKKIYKNIIVLDAGHGGYDPGARNKGVNEKDLNFKIIYTLMKDYFASNAPDIKVYWTRTSDVFITLANRAAFAKKVGADAFISLHMNSAVSSSANGTEVYYSVSNNKESFSGITSKSMANLFKNQLIGDLKTKNRGVKTAAYYVCRHNTVPAILIELGFLSGNKDFSKLKKASFQKKATKSIYTGIVSMFTTYPTGR